MLRFVLLYHDCPTNFGRPSHWDLMFESGEVLRTWAIERLPCDWQIAHQHTAAKYPLCGSIAQGHVVPATKLADHRRDYLELEGPLSGDRGYVVRITSGTYRIQLETAEHWQLTLTGPQISGPLKLTRTSAEGTQWSLECEERE